MSLPERFPTYDQIQRIAKSVHDINISTCEIADAKRMLGYRVRFAHNRIMHLQNRKGCSNRKLRIVREICLDLERGRMGQFMKSLFLM